MEVCIRSQNNKARRLADVEQTEPAILKTLSALGCLDRQKAWSKVLKPCKKWQHVKSSFLQCLQTLSLLFSGVVL